MKFKAKTTPTETELEILNRVVSKRAALEGIVLLENDGVLPFATDIRTIALYGNGARKTIKGGTGSGDVNERSVVSVENGLENAGFEIVTKEWLDKYDQKWRRDRAEWKNELDRLVEEHHWPFAKAYLETVHLVPSDYLITENDIVHADVAVYVIARRSGEGTDRLSGKGDFCLFDEERKSLEVLAQKYRKVIVILNAGGPMDVSFFHQVEGLSALIVYSYAGMEGGNALADILTGKVTPSGKLADTYAKEYQDYSCADEFSLHSGDPEHVFYKEGIFVGYRWFDSMQIEPLYCFGFGLSYTEFAIKFVNCAQIKGLLCFDIKITNTGSHYSGKEVVQLYCQYPNGNFEKPVRTLVAFAKSKTLLPSESQTLQLTCSIKDFASYDEVTAEWILEPGDYIFLAGNSSRNLSPAIKVKVLNRTVLEKLSNRLSPKCSIQEYKRKAPYEYLTYDRVLILNHSEIECRTVNYALSEKSPVADILRALPDEDLINTVIGNSPKRNWEMVGNASITVPGAAGESYSAIREIPKLVLADGGAGVRLVAHFFSDENGNLVPFEEMAALEGGAFANLVIPPSLHTDYYQYCTSFPTGTVLAQTWNQELLNEVGKAVSAEMAEFGVHLWLAPGMNIHRNPLGGRNFEYFSEDPLLTGLLVSAVCQGVANNPHTGVTIKHFAANNQENCRLTSDSIVSERALREIYLRGFEIVVNQSNPAAIMTSYNLINETHTANSYDLCTAIAKCEWSFKGLIMTDWGTTYPGDSDPAMCILAGNDLIMPGADQDKEGLRTALRNGKINRAQLESCAARIIMTALKINC